MYQNALIFAVMCVLHLCKDCAAADWTRPCARRFRSYCFNGGTCFRVRSLASKVCRCPEGFAGLRCEFQDANLDLTARTLESVDRPLAEHDFAHAHAGKDDVEEVTDPESFSAVRTVVGEETIMDRVRRSKYGLLGMRNRRHSLAGPEQNPRQRLLSSLLSKILQMKRHRTS